jgi:hypothetical protein
MDAIYIPFVFLIGYLIFRRYRSWQLAKDRRDEYLEKILKSKEYRVKGKYEA